MARTAKMLSLERIGESIHFLRGQKVMLDFDLAALYGVEARVLNQAVKRNLERFPADFMFQLSKEEMNILTHTSSSFSALSNSSQIVMSSMKHRGSTYRFYAFTEQGVAMLSSVLRSARAVQVNIEIMRAFVKLRQILSADTTLSRRLDTLEKKYDRKFRVVFEAIRELMRDGVADQPKREIGFHAGLAARDSKARAKRKQNSP